MISGPQMIVFATYYSRFDILTENHKILIYCSWDQSDSTRTLTISTSYAATLLLETGKSEYVVSEFDEGRNGGKLGSTDGLILGAKYRS